MKCVECPIREECLSGWIATKAGTFNCENVIDLADSVSEDSKDENDN